MSYIKSTSTGQQYINTGYTPKASDVVSCEVDVENNQGTYSYATIFGARKNNSSNGYVFFSHVSYANPNRPQYLRDTGNTGNGAMGTKSMFTCGKRIRLVCDATSATWWPLDDPSSSKTLALPTAATDDCSAPLFIFGLNLGADGGLEPHGGTTWCVMKLYSFKIESGETTVCHFLPYRTAAGKLGVYDIANPSGGAAATHLNQSTGVDFEWGGVAYTREDDGATIVLREGVLSDFDIADYSHVKNAAVTPVDATAVTNYPALTLEQGTLSLQDGVTREYRVANTLALTGGAVLAIDLTETANDRFVAGSVDLSGVSAGNPAVIEIRRSSGIAALAPGVVRPLIAAEGLVAADAAKFTVKGFPAEVAFADGALVLRGLEPGVVVWSGADASSTDWSCANNWVGEAVPPSGATVAFDHTAGGTTTFDLNEYIEGVRISAAAGAFTHGGEKRLSVTSFITNLSANAQTFTLPISVGVDGSPFEIHTDGPLALTGDVTTPGASIRKTGSGPLTLAVFPAGSSFSLDEGTCVCVSAGASTLNGSLTVSADTTLALSNTVQVTWAGAVTNNGVIVHDTPGAVVFSGPLHGSGRLEGSNIKMSATECWYLTHGDTGWTEKMDVEHAGDFLPSVRKMDVTVADSALPAEPLVICPHGGLNMAHVVRNIALTVRDGSGERIPNCWLDIVGENLVLHLADSGFVRFAVWTGRGVDPNNYSDAANWSCSNDVNEVVVDGVPMEQTSVIIAGSACNFNFPAGASLACREIVFADTVALGADCDWRGLDANLTGTIDLCGHVLRVSDLKGTATITDSTECYQPVEYIQSSGGQYINTDYTPKASDVVVCEVDVENDQGTYSYATIFGARKNNSSNGYVFFSHVSSANPNRPQYLRDTGNGAMGTKSMFTCGKRIRLVCDATSATWWPLDDPSSSKTLALPTAATDDCSAPLFIFGLNLGGDGGLEPHGGTTWIKMKLYSFQIFDQDGNLKRDFIPVRKLPSGEGALWDRVSDQPFENIGSGAFTAGTATESVRAGELHFDVPSGTKTHSAVLLAGAVRLVKDGAGTLTLSMQNQTYNGGTDVAAGTLAVAARGSLRPYGAAGNTVWVRTNATFNVQSYANHCDYTFVLDGGTLTGSGDLTNGSDWFRRVVLTADSYMRGQNFGFVGPAFAGTTLEMNGHALTVEVTKSAQEFYMANLTVTGGGRIVCINGGWLTLGGNHSTGDKYVHADTTTLEVPNISTKCSSQDVRFAGYLANYLGGNTSTDTGVITVTERFKPSSVSAKWHDAQLMDGVTMDLSALSETFNTTCTYTISGGTRTVMFAPGGTILVDLGSRHVKSGSQVISWTSEHVPDDSVTFKLAPGHSGLLKRTATGVGYCKGFAVFIR